MFSHSKRLGCYLPLLSILLIFLGGCGEEPTGERSSGEVSTNESQIIPSMDRVKEYVVEVVTAGGNVIKNKTKTLAEALQLAWRRLFPEWDGKVAIDPLDPRRGTLHGVYRLTVKIIREDGRKDSISITLNDPLMRRATVGSHDWEPDAENYPPRIRETISEEKVE